MCTVWGNVSSSTDGIQWVPLSEKVLPGDFCKLGEMGGKVTAVRMQNEEIAFSEDLQNWTKEKLPDKSNWYAHQYGNGILIIIDSDKNRIAIRK